MKKTAHIIFGIFFTLHCPVLLKAQILTDSQSAATMVHAIMGDHPIILNETLECHPLSTGIYTGDLGIGLDPAGGAIIGNGKLDSIIYGELIFTQLGITVAPPPMTDFDFYNLALSQGYNGNNSTLTLCTLSFDMVPLADSITFPFVFAALAAKFEPCWSTYAIDLMGVFISGGAYTQPTNIAFVPGTDIVVSNNSITTQTPFVGDINNCGAFCNGCSYTQYYVENVAGSFSPLRYPGFTLPLYAGAALSPCDTYHIKIGMLKLQNHAASLFIGPAVYTNPLPPAAQSLTAQSTPGMPDTPQAQVCRGCSGSFTIVRESSSAAQNISYTLSGSAINGTDYAPLSGSVSFEPGQDTAIVTVEALNVEPPQPPQTLVLSVYSNPPCGTPGYLRDTMLIIDRNYTGIEGPEEIFPFQIAPNPFHNSISVFAPPHENWQAELYDITGRSCRSVSGNTERLNASLGNLESLQAGIYILKVSRMPDGRKAVFKLIKE